MAANNRRDFFIEQLRTILATIPGVTVLNTHVGETPHVRPSVHPRLWSDYNKHDTTYDAGEHSHKLSELWFTRVNVGIFFSIEKDVDSLGLLQAASNDWMEKVADKILNLDNWTRIFTYPDNSKKVKIDSIIHFQSIPETATDEGTEGVASIGFDIYYTERIKNNG